MAGRFQFRLEVVRRVRELRRDAQRRTVADAVAAVDRVEQRIAGLTQQLRDTVGRTRRDKQEQRLDLASLRGHQFYCGRLHRQIMESDVELGKCRADLDRERGELAEATKRLNVIEKLRDKHWTRYKVELAREEQLSFDESAVQAYLRRSGGLALEAGMSS